MSAHHNSLRVFLKGALLGGGAVLALSAGAAAQEDENIETVVITGYRASLQQALQLKRDSVGVRDSIVAEDIGKYPATNIADSLMRVPGIVVGRDSRTDEGKSVTVRGLSANYTIVTVNGIPVHMETGTSIGSNSRAVDLDAFGADLFSRVDFYKSPQADLDEGGIGGVIDMRTPHPFDYTGRKIGYSLEYSNNTNRNKYMPGGTFQLSDTMGPFGVLFAMTFRESSYQLMGSEQTGWGQSRNENGDNTNSITYDFGPENGGYDSRANIGSYTTGQVEQAFVPRFVRNHLELDDRTRYSGLVSLQYKPNDDLDVSFDFLGAELIDKRSEYTLGMTFRSTSTTASSWAACQEDSSLIGTAGCSGLVPVNIAIDNNNNLYGTFSNVSWYNENRWYDGKDKYGSATMNVSYAVSRDWKLDAVASIGDFHGFYSDNRIYTIAYNTTVTYDPTVNYKIAALITDTDFTDPSIYTATPTVDANYYKEGDRVVTGKLGSTYEFESGTGFLGHIQFKSGISWVSTQKTNDKKSNGDAVANTTLWNGETIASMSFSDMAQKHLPVTNFLSGIAHGERPIDWATISRKFYERVGFNKILKQQESSLSSVFDVTEAVESAFIMFNTDGVVLDRDLKLSAGLRVARTRLWGFNYSSSLDDDDNTVYTQTRLHNAYDDLLPTFSAAYNLRDNLVMRAAYGKTITRPGLGNIAQSTTISSRFNAAASSGNPTLKPMVANNVDVSVEWYFQPESVLTVGVFYKGLKNLISTQTQTVSFGSLGLPDSSLDASVWGDENGNIPDDLSIELSHPINLNPMVVKGFEVYYQQPFTFLPEPFDGLGSMLSFTYTAGSQSGAGTGFTANDGSVYQMQINGLSTYTYSASGYYEKGPYSVRLSYNWRSKSPAGSSNYYSTNLRLWNQARGTLDASVGYQFSEMLEVRLDATNLFDSDDTEFLDQAARESSLIGERYSGAGRGTSREMYDYYHGTTLSLSVRGHF